MAVDSSYSSSVHSLLPKDNLLGTYIYLLTNAIFIWILQVLKKCRIYREGTCVL